MPEKSKSEVYAFLKVIVAHWNTVAIRVFQDGKWQSLFLSEIKSDRAVADWIVTKLQDTRFGKR
jgi:hypothetical protein